MSSKICLEKQPEESSRDTATKEEPIPDGSQVGISSGAVEHNSSADTACSEESLLDSFVLLCCVDSTRLFSTKSVIQVPLAFFIFNYNFIVAIDPC